MLAVGVYNVRWGIHFFLCSSHIPLRQCFRFPRTSMPYSIGLQAANVALLSAGLATHIATAIVVLLLILIVASSCAEDPSKKEDAPISLPGISLLAIVPFFRQRFDFINWGFQATGRSIYQFKLLRVSSFPLSSFISLIFADIEHRHYRLWRICAIGFLHCQTFRPDGRFQDPVRSRECAMPWRVHFASLAACSSTLSCRYRWSRA